MNRGQLIVDATCALADIRYPTNVSLLVTGQQSNSLFDLKRLNDVEGGSQTYQDFIDRFVKPFRCLRGFDLPPHSMTCRKVWSC